MAPDLSCLEPHARAPHTEHADESLAIHDRPGAYQWWYFDAHSDDGQWAMVAIVFVGSVFSPWYAGRLAAGEQPRPRQHCAVNLALYRRGGFGAAHWVFSEYGERVVSGRLAPELRIGRNAPHIDPSGYDLAIDDEEAVLRRRVRGRIRFDAIERVASTVAIDSAGAHRWIPAAPQVRFRATFSNPALQFEGTGYHDLNHGDAPLASDFSRWTWGRVHHRGRTHIGYDRTEIDGSRRVLSVDVDPAHAPRIRDRIEPASQKRRVGAWALPEPSVVLVGNERLAMPRRCDSSPFYARYAGADRDGRRIVAEHLDLQRFTRPVVQRLLPFRARRVG